MPKKRTPDTVAEVLAKARQSLGLSRYALAKLSGLSDAAINDIETGKRLDPRWSTIVKLSDALEISTEQFRGKKKSENN